MVVTRQRNDAAKRRGTGQIRVLERIRAAVHTGALAVPNAEHTVVFPVVPVKFELLRTPDSGDAQFLVDARLEHDVLFGEMLFRLPERLVVSAQRRTPISGNERGGLMASLRVALALHDRQAHQRLHTIHEGARGLQCVLVVERDDLHGLSGRFCKRGIHMTDSPMYVVRMTNRIAW